MQVLYSNSILTAILTRSSENPGYPIANVQDTKILKAFRTLSASGEWIKITSPAVTASRFAIMGHNLSAAAVIQLQGNDTDVWTAPTFDETITWKAGIIIHQFTEVTYNFWRLLITDSGRTYISIGELYIGTFLQLPNIKTDAQIDDETTSEGVESSSGQLFGNEGYDFRTITVNFNVTEAQRTAIRAWWAYCENIRPFIAVIWANREDIEPPLYCHIDQKMISWKKTGSATIPYSTTIKFKEVY